jgi:hypothetical protein
MSPVPAATQERRRRLRCRIGFHRWVRIQHRDLDLESPGQEVVWRTMCRDCGLERGSGLRSMAVLVVVVAVAGGLLWWLISPVLGVLLLAAGVIGLGWAARMTALGRAGSFGFRYRG